MKGSWWWLGSLMLVLLSANGFASSPGYTDIVVLQTSTHDIRFVSDRTVYVEGLVNGVWSGRYWSAGGRINVPYELSADSAFELRAEGIDLSSGWTWIGAHEESRTASGARHFVVELSGGGGAVKLSIHTVLDGTPIIERWLDIQNTGKSALPLTTVFPWTGRLWRTPYFYEKGIPAADPIFTLGSFARNTHGWEGWLEWKQLTDSFTDVSSQVGHGFRAPFFIARNEIAGEYFICHLAWSANWEMSFYSTNDGFEAHQDGPGRYASLWFKGGPSDGIGWAGASALPQRVVSPGENVHTPAIHLGPIQGDLDDAVQAMHAHIRSTVEAPRDPKRAYLIEYAVPGDQGYIAKFAGDTSGMNEHNIYQQIDIAHALGAELFIVDAGWWDIYGDWTASPSRFPHGLGPIADYVHKQGMLFGLYNEVRVGAVTGLIVPCTSNIPIGSYRPMH